VLAQELFPRSSPKESFIGRVFLEPTEQVGSDWKGVFILALTRAQLGPRNLFLVSLNSVVSGRGPGKVIGLGALAFHWFC